MQPGVLQVTMRWIVCGAGRRVGKTHLARELCEVLPHAVYAKQGHGRPNKRKPPNYFRDHEALGRFLARCEGRSEHVVVESNELARRGEGDVIIYVDAPPGMADVRDDAARLMQAADVRVAASSTMRDWRRALRGSLADGGLREGVCQALWAQKRYLFGEGLAVRSKVWFVCDGEHVFGPGLARLLEGVERHGTLSAAARAEGMSYRHAWDDLRAAEERLGERMVLRRPGGAGGGQSRLSAEGRRLLAAFRRVERQVADFADDRFAHCIQDGADG